ncbi:MAG: glycosyltransferase family 39 protein [Alphaproteobacteria bacterium]|nr:glycosyltransferase family 39 protein [Alphaproteobacteria bacterium]
MLQKITAKFADKFKVIAFLAGFVVVILMLYQFFMRHGFWNDEISLADNFMFLDFSRLTGKLFHRQVAPLGFLFWERAVWLLAKNSVYIEYWWRIYPFLCGLGIVFLYYPTAYRLTGSKVIALFSYLFLIFLPVFIYYTSEVKQYIGELFSTVLLLYFWSKAGEKWTFKRVLTLIAVIAFGVFNSLTMCFVLLPLGLWDGFELLRNARYRIISMLKSKEFRLYVLQYGTALAFLLIYYFMFLHNHPHKPYMEYYWQSTFATGSNFWQLWMNNFHLYFWKLPGFFCVLAFLSLLCLKNRFVLFYTAVIVVTHTIFSALHLYPLFARLIFYWFSFMPIVMACLWYFPYDFICRFLEKRGYRIKYQAIALLIGIASIIGVQIMQPLKLPIYLNGSYLKDVFAYINRNYQKGDIILAEDFELSAIYFRKYYFKNIEYKDIISIMEENWQNFLVIALVEKLNAYQSEKYWLIMRKERPNKIEEKIHRVLDVVYPDGRVTLEYCTVPVSRNTVCLIRKKYFSVHSDNITAK